MKYLEQYIEEKMKIKILGKLTTRESSKGDDVGVSLVIDGYEPGIEVWWADYACWIDEKIEKSCYKNLFGDCYYENMFSGCEKKHYTPNVKKLTFEEFRDDVLTAMKDKPKNWRDGQFVFNYIDSEYGVSRYVQLNEGVDCFYQNNMIEEFIKTSYDVLLKANYISDKEEKIC